MEQCRGNGRMYRSKTGMLALFQEKTRYEEVFVVTEEVYNTFQVCSRDKNPLHVDETFARAKGFRDKVMYGNILNAFISYFVGECLPTKDVIIHSQEINYKNPVYLGDELQFDAVVEGVYESVNAVVFKFRFSNQGKIMAKGKIQIGVFI